MPSSSLGCILLGAPGGGKGTQAKRLQDKFAIPHISTGDMLRAEIGAGTELGKRVKAVVDAGNLVNDALMFEILEARFKKADVEKGYLLDGYPRNVSQAESLDKVLKARKLKDPLVLYFELPLSVLMERILGRLSCGKCGSVFHKTLNPPKKDNICDKCGATLVQRKDDSEEAVKVRLEVFQKETQPLLNFYEKRGVLKRIDGTQAVDKITEQVEKIFQAKLQ